MFALLSFAMLIAMEPEIQLQLYEPFENNYEIITIDELTIENNFTTISIYGELTISKDKNSLIKLKLLEKNINHIIKTLETQTKEPHQ